MHGTCACSAALPKNRANSRSADATGTRRRSGERIARSQAPGRAQGTAGHGGGAQAAPEVAIATGTLAELYLGAGRNQALDALLARESGDGLLLRDTDRTLARLIGALLTEARASSALFADAHPVAVAVEAGGGIVQTADPDNLGRLAAPYRTVVIEPLAQRKSLPARGARHRPPVSSNVTALIPRTNHQVRPPRAWRTA